MKISPGLTILIFAVLFGILLFALVYLFSNLILRPARMANWINPGNLGVPYENVEFSASDGAKICGWFVPAGKNALPTGGRSAAAKKSGPQLTPSGKTIIMCHGWGANRSDIMSTTLYLREAGFNLLYLDFRRHGQSGGKYFTFGALETSDIRTALAWLRANHPRQAAKIGIYGISMGASVAISAAAEEPEILAVVADSAFSSYNKTVAHFAKIFYGLPKFPLVNLVLGLTKLRAGLDPEPSSAAHHIAKISPRPILLIQGGKDRRIPQEEGETLYELAGRPKELWVVPDADHMEAHQMNTAEYERRASEFFRRTLR